MTPTATFNTYALIPGYVRRLLLIGHDRSLFEARFQNGIKEMWQTRCLPKVSDQVQSSYFDCILVTNIADITKDLNRLFSATHTLLNPDGLFSILFSQPAHNGFTGDSIDNLLMDFGFLSYKLYSRKDLAPTDFTAALVAVRNSYNPAAHARRLSGLGRFENAIEILENIPPKLIGNMEGLAHIAAEKQRLCLKWQKSLSAEVPRHKLLFKSQRELAQVTLTLPEHPPAYWVYADFWRHIGNNRMAARTLRSILHVDFNPQTKTRLLEIPAEPLTFDSAPAPPIWSGKQTLPRLLILTHDHSDFGLDTLYDGLCGILGQENVVEFPWKPSLHGREKKRANNYPCVFNYGSKPRSVKQIVSELKENRFDVILFADVVQMAYPEEVKLFMAAAKHLPVVLYDTWDNSYTPLRNVFEYLGRKTVDLFFKREMLQGVDYGPRSFPLPFGYPESRIPPGPSDSERTVDIFWAGKRIWGLRPIYISWLEKRFNRKFDQTFPQEEYAKRIRSARIGLSFFGSGFDTVRYWELPAHGAMLFAERPPIRIPDNFADGQTAVFFDDLPELKEKLDYYISHPAEVARIAAAGHQHFKSHHTTSCRARQFLGYLQKHFSR